MTVHDFDPNYQADVWPEHWRTLKQRQAVTFETVHRAQDGREFPVEVTVNYLAYGGKEYNCAFARDISGRKRAEERLRRHREDLTQRVEQRTRELADLNRRLRAELAERRQAEQVLQAERDQSARIISGTPALVCGVAPDGTTTFVNPAGERITGYRAAELVGRNWWRVLCPGEAYQQVEPLLRELQQEDVRDYEFMLTTRSGEKRIIAWNSVNRFDEAGRLVEIIGFGNDVTEQRRAEDALRESEQRFRQLAENIHEGFWLSAPTSGEALYVSPAYEQLAGRPRSDFYAHPDLWIEQVHPDDRARILADLERQLEGQPTEHEYRLIRPDGTLRWVRARAFPVRNETGEVYRIAGVTEDITERRQREDELRKFKTITDQAAYGAAIVDLDGNLTYVNNAFAGMHGYTPRELIGRHLSIFHTEDQMPRVNELNESLKRTGSYVGQEVWHVRRDGTVFPTSMNAAIIRDESGTPALLSATAIDITERKQAENLLRLQYDLGLALGTTSNLRDTVSQLLAAALRIEGFDCGGVYLVDEETGVLELVVHENLSPSFVEKAGRRGPDTPLAQLVRAGKPVYWQSPEELATQDLLVREGLRTLAVIPVQHEGRTIAALNVASHREGEIPLGNRHAIEALAARLGGVLSRVRAETALQQSEELFRTVVAASKDAMVAINRAGRITIFNPAAEELFGRTRGAVVGRSLDCFLPDEYRERHRQSVRDYFTTGARHDVIGRTLELPALRGDGTVVPVELSLSAGQRGNEPFVLAVIRDVTDRKRAEEAARQHHAQLVHVSRVSTIGEMASGLAHEMAQPLSAILYYARGATTRLKSGQWGVGEATTAMRKMAAQAERAGQFVRRLKAFVRKAQPRRVPSDINQVVREALAIAAPEAREQNVTVNLDLADALPEVVVDPIQIEQVILNLLRNGMEAMEQTPAAERALLIRTSTGPDNVVQVIVRDQGCGLPPEIAERVFDPFFSTKDTGTGLGLSISRSIIEAHEGELWGAPAPVRGAEFGFRLSTVKDADHETD